MKNELNTRADFVRAAMDLIGPLIPHLTDGNAGLHLGDSGAVYPAEVAEMEGFSRILWAIVPMLAAGDAEIEPIWALWREGIAHGTDPGHPAYWGDIGPTDQRMVEMAAPAMGLCFARARCWDELSAGQRRNLHAWLNQINLHDMPTNNWRFFRVLVNSAFRLLGQSYSAERLDEDFALIEAHYESDGWYFDYESQREYYTPWGYHFYGLLYAACMRALDPARCDLYIERARLFAPRFLRWFDRDCEALAYGRSMAYRFAQVSFFSAMALAGVEMPGVGFGEMRYLIAGNLRRWLARPIFDSRGVLTIGYGYPNLNMAEGYNAPGSPYWAMKLFACLALPADHPFWRADERAPAVPDGLFRDAHARMLIERSRGGAHVVAYQAGNHADGYAHGEAKYEKFAYSSHFAFSVPKSAAYLAGGAFDSMLAVSLDGSNWHPRFGCARFEITGRAVRCAWTPFPGVEIETEITPLGDWHLRRHRIVTDRALHLAEGGFAIRREFGREQPALIEEMGGCCVLSDWGASGVRALAGWDRCQIVRPEPNTNLLHPRTLLPTLIGALPPGEHHLSALVLGAPSGGMDCWTNIPEEVSSLAKMG